MTDDGRPLSIAQALAVKRELDATRGLPAAAVDRRGFFGILAALVPATAAAARAPSPEPPFQSEELDQRIRDTQRLACAEAKLSETRLNAQWKLAASMTDRDAPMVITGRSSPGFTEFEPFDPQTGDRFLARGYNRLERTIVLWQGCRENDKLIAANGAVCYSANGLDRFRIWEDVPFAVRRTRNHAQLGASDPPGSRRRRANHLQIS